MITPIGLRPMHSRPNPGQRVTVLMRDGTQLHDCCATMIYVADRAGIVIYNKRKAVDESLAKGWWPVTPNAKVTGSPALSASPSGLPGYATEVEK